MLDVPGFDPSPPVTIGEVCPAPVFDVLGFYPSPPVEVNNTLPPPFTEEWFSSTV